MNHNHIYNAIIVSFQKSGKNYLTKDDLGENHHIVPRSLGGNNDKSNIVRLSHRAHFICHLLLTKMYVGEARAKMVCALWYMTGNGRYTNRLTSKQYETLRKEVGLNHSIRINDRIKNGTYHLCDPKLQSELGKKGGKKSGPRARERVANGTHHWQKPEAGEFTRQRLLKQIEDGTHAFVNSEFQSKLQLKRLSDGTHPFNNRENILKGNQRGNFTNFVKWAIWRRDNRRPSKFGDEFLVLYEDIVTARIKETHPLIKRNKNV